ncbi:XtrA/YqaO family protein [Bacillus subtilis]|nr:XtrA/YqaO family protein [Bacillus subtilis]
MYNPREINIKKDFTIQQKIDPGKVKIIVLDGNQGTAHVLDAPEHGKTVIQTVKGSFARVDHEIGYKVM